MIKLALEQLSAEELEMAAGIGAILGKHNMIFNTKEEKLAMVFDLMATLTEETDG